MNFRSDLALEETESLGRDNLPQGVKVDALQYDSITVNIVDITSEQGSEALGKPVGRYLTVELPPFYSCLLYTSCRSISVPAPVTGGPRRR